MDYPFYNIVLPRYVHPMAMVSGSLIATALFSLVPLLWQKAEKVEKADVRKLIGAALLIGVLRKVFIMYGLSMTSPIDGGRGAGGRVVVAPAFAPLGQRDDSALRLRYVALHGVVQAADRQIPDYDRAEVALLRGGGRRPAVRP